MMNRSYRIWMILPVLLALGFSPKAQTCDWRALPGAEVTTSVLDVLTGPLSPPPSSGAASLPDNSAQFLDMLDQGIPLNVDSAGLRKSLFGSGMSSMQSGKFADAVRLFTAAGQGLDEDSDCGLRFFRLAARYLDSYGAEAPIFPHFNGGFHNYLKDSLFWGNADTAQYERALAASLEMVQWTNTTSPVYLELLGDVLTGYPDRFIANYFAWLAYTRAANLGKGAQHEAFFRKANFALEYPNTNEDRFNRYRYTQLGKALDEDLLLTSATVQAFPVAPPVVFFPETSEKRLNAMLKKAREEQLARSNRILKFDQEVNRKEVKRDTRFNAYALFLIAVIIGSVIFFWVKLRRANRGE